MLLVAGMRQCPMASEVLASMIGGPLDGTRQAVQPPPSVYVHFYRDGNGQDWQCMYEWVLEDGKMPTTMRAEGPPEQID